jgi:flagellar protein FlaG
MSPELAALSAGRNPSSAQPKAAASVRSAREQAPARPALEVVSALEPNAAALKARQAQAAAAEATRKLAEKGSELTIEFEDALGRMVFRLVDTQTREVVRQIPSEEVLAIARALAADESAGVLLRGNA